MGRGPPCCCCFSNNVRHLLLLLCLLCVSALFSNFILFNFTSVLHPDLPGHLKPVASLTSLHEYSTWHDRRKRSTNETRDLPAQSDDGVPLLPVGSITTTTPPPTTTLSTTPTTPRLMFFTNSPTARKTTRVVRATTEQTTKGGESTTTTSTTAPTTTTTRNVVMEEVQKAIDKFENKDKDLDNTGEALDKATIWGTPPVEESTYVTRTLLYSAAGLGCLLGTVPSMLLIRCFGVRVVFSASLFLSSLIMIPFGYLVPLGFGALFPLRFVLGLCFSTSLPVVGSLVANWGTLKEQITFIAVTILFITLGPVFSWPFTMVLYSNEVELEYIYIMHAVGTLILAISFLILYRDRPQFHPWVNGLELNRIVAGKVQELRHNRILDAPWTTLVRSISAWVVWVAAFGFFTVVALFSMYLPSFLSCQQVFMVDNLGTYSVLPYLIFPLFLLVGGIANRFSCSSTTVHLRICNTLSFVLCALLVIAIPILFSVDNTSIALHVLLLSLAPLGLAISGFLRSATIVGRLYSQHIIGSMGISLGLAYTIWPFVVNSMVEENVLKEWLRVFLIGAAILVTTAIVFAIFGRGRSAGWAESSWDPLVRTKMRSLNPIDRSQDECGLYELRLVDSSKR